MVPTRNSLQITQNASERMEKAIHKNADEKKVTVAIYLQNRL